MIDDRDMAARCEVLRAQFRDKMGVRSRDLKQAFSRAGRRIPRHLRAQGKLLVEAEQYAAHPKLAKRIDERAVKRAFEAIGAHLKSIDIADQRRGAWLSLAGSIVFNVLAVGIVFLAYLWWRGHI